MMRKAFFELLLTASLLSGGCASAQMPPGPRDPSHPGSAVAPLPAGVGVLAADFDPERVAPRAPAGADAHAEHGGHGGHSMGEGAKAAPDPSIHAYTCPHHPEVVSDKPGVCPKCGMDLIPNKAPSPVAPPAGTDHSGHEGH